LENVLRISLEEEKAREAKKKEDEDKKAKEVQVVEGVKIVDESAQNKKDEIDDLDEEELMKRAQELSL